jgi:hypothetical protein
MKITNPAFIGKKRVAIVMRMPPANQIFPASWWVALQVSSLSNVQGVRMPTK